MPKLHSITVLTDASGDSTAYGATIGGRVLGAYHDAGLPDGVIFTITLESSGTTVLVDNTASNALLLFSGDYLGLEATGHLLLSQDYVAQWFWPRRQLHDVADGAALTLDGTQLNVDYVWCEGLERTKVVVSGGGAAQTGVVKILSDE